MKKISLLLSIAIVLSISANAQKFKPKAEFLKGQTEFAVKFDFSGFTLDGDSQADYVKERLADEKTQADKDKWKKDWDNAPNEWAQKFLDDANGTFKGKAKIAENAKAEYTVNIQVKDVDPGNFAGPFSNPAKINATVTITKTGSKEVLATAEFKNIFSAVGAFPAETIRIKMAFGRFGDEVADLLWKSAK